LLVDEQQRAIRPDADLGADVVVEWRGEGLPAARAADEQLVPGVDAIEVRNAKTSLESLNRRAAEYASIHGIRAGAGSDAHVPDAVGAAYVEMPDFDGPASFLSALGEAVVVGHHFDDARPWAPRIVPSTGD
jgi:predicted metal-dependent phosphoesterase TrpH